MSVMSRIHFKIILHISMFSVVSHSRRDKYEIAEVNFKSERPGKAVTASLNTPSLFSVNKKRRKEVKETTFSLFVYSFLL